MKGILTRLAITSSFILSFYFTACKSDENLNIVYPEGGYPYLNDVKPVDSNFYFLPVRHTISRSDSIFVLNYKKIFKSFNEPNLSLGPPAEDIFRFTYECPFLGEWAIITLTKDKIIIKENKSGSPYKAPNEEVLDSIEKLHYYLLESYYPLTEAKFPVWRKKHIDSLLKVYPQLLEPGYYMKLQEKVFSVNQKPLEYSLKSIKIPRSKYLYIIQLINESGYWNMQYDVENCSIMDGSGFSLEAITKNKYKCTVFTLCPDDTSSLKEAYNEVLKYAGVDYGKLGREDTTKLIEHDKIEVREIPLIELKQENN
jgi:hypothetical protein